MWGNRNAKKIIFIFRLNPEREDGGNEEDLNFNNGFDFIVLPPHC